MNVRACTTGEPRVNFFACPLYKARVNETLCHITKEKGRKISLSEAADPKNNGIQAEEEIFVGIQIRQVMKDETFPAKLNERSVLHGRHSNSSAFGSRKTKTNPITNK
jgi:hypothetical protein